MPTALRFLLYTTAACVILLGFMLYQAQPLAQQSVTVHQQSAAAALGGGEHGGVSTESGGATSNIRLRGMCARHSGGLRR